MRALTKYQILQNSLLNAAGLRAGMTREQTRLSWCLVITEVRTMFCRPSYMRQWLTTVYANCLARTLMYSLTTCISTLTRRCAVVSSAWHQTKAGIFVRQQKNTLQVSPKIQTLIMLRAVHGQDIGSTKSSNCSWICCTILVCVTMMVLVLLIMNYAIYFGAVIRTSQNRDIIAIISVLQKTR